jgi:hypothetical protein
MDNVWVTIALRLLSVCSTFAQRLLNVCSGSSSSSLSGGCPPCRFYPFFLELDAPIAVLLKASVPALPVLANRELVSEQVPHLANARRETLEVRDVIGQAAAIPGDHKQDQVVASLLRRPAERRCQEVPDVQRHVDVNFVLGHR